MSFNRFIAGQAPTATDDADVLDNGVMDAEESASDAPEIDPVTGKKKRKPSKPRDKKNVSITKEQRIEILRRYAEETPSAIAMDMGLEARQVYNIVRNTRLKLEAGIKALDPNNPENTSRIATLESALAKLPHKEFGGGAAGPRANSLSEDDIIASLLGD